MSVRRAVSDRVNKKPSQSDPSDEFLFSGECVSISVCFYCIVGYLCSDENTKTTFTEFNFSLLYSTNLRQSNVFRICRPLTLSPPCFPQPAKHHYNISYIIFLKQTQHLVLWLTPCLTSHKYIFIYMKLHDEKTIDDI